jgi:hypothetical protein
MAPNLVELVLRDHEREIELFQRVLAVPNGQDREEVLGELLALLVSHEAAESLVFYPALSHFVPGGERIAHASLGEHRSQETLLAKACRLGVDHRAFGPVFEELRTFSISHMRDEEVLLIPMMREAGSRTLLNRLGERYAAIRTTTALHVPSISSLVGTQLRRLVNEAHRTAHLTLARGEFDATMGASRGAA